MSKATHAALKPTGGDVPFPFAKLTETKVIEVIPLIGLVKPEGPNYCRDAATHRLIHGIPEQQTRLAACTQPAQQALEAASDTKQRVMVIGYMVEGIEPGCAYVNCWYAGPPLPPSVDHLLTLQTVSSVESVDLKLIKSILPHLALFVVGTVPTGGWTNGTLIPKPIVIPPADGIQDFDLVAEPPAGFVPQVLSPIPAAHLITPIPPWLKGVRVHASHNQMEAMLAQAERLDLSKRGPSA